MLLEQPITTSLPFDDIEPSLTALKGWAWNRGESDFIGTHLIGRHTSGIRCDIISNTTGYDVSVEGDDHAALQAAIRMVIKTIESD